MKTIDEQLNIINDTKNGIAQVLNSKGVEVTADTKFADYPDKVAQLMGNAEVDASVSAALTEVTAEYLEQVNAVKAQADGLEESKLDVSVAEATYQPKGDYLTQHQDISGKLDVSVAAETYQPKGAYLTEHQDISGKLDASVAEATYQPKGDYLTQHQDISGKLDASVAAETYQPKGNYQPAGNYLTEHQDISGKLDASVAEATYQPKGAYLTEHQSLADYALKSELPLVPTNVSAFTNDAGYLTSHQDISNLLDVSTAAETYATKSDVTLGSGSGATLRYDAQDGIADNDAVNGVSLNHIEVCLRFLPYDESEDLNYVVFHDTVVGNIYLWRIGSDWYLSQNDSANATEINYLLKGTATLSQSETYKDTAVKKYDVVFPEAFTLHADTVAFGSGIYIGTTTYGYIYAYDTSVKTLKAAVTEMMGAGYLTQHQDISGKLDASVAATTYAAKSDLVVSQEVQLDVSNALATVTGLYFDKNNTDYSLSDHMYEDVHFKVASHPLYNNREISYALRYNETDGHWYTFAYGTGDSTRGNASDPLFDMTQVWDPYENGQNLYYKINGNPTMSIVRDPSTGANYRIVIEFETPTEFYVNTASDVHVDGETAVWTGLSTQTWKQYVDGKFATVPTKTSDLTNDSSFISEHQDISGKLDASVAAATYALKADTIYAEVDVSTNHGATDDLSTTPVTFTCDKMKFTCEGGWEGMANTSEKSAGLTITCDEGTVKLIKLNGVFTLTTAYSWREVTEANTITTVKESNFTYDLNEITFNDKVTLTNVTAVTVFSFGSNVQMTTTEHVVTTVKQKIAQLEALIATLHPQS